MAKQVELFE
jgi:hypothetical protein